MPCGTTVQDAVHEAVHELARLQGGYQGQVVIHAISSEGEPYVATTHKDDKLTYWLWNTRTQILQEIKPILVPV